MGAAGAMGAWRRAEAGEPRVAHSLLVTLVGLVASATHLGNPDNALYVFSRVGRSPLSNEVFAAVLFLSASGLHWLYQFAEHAPSARVEYADGAAILASFAFVASVALAYASRTVVTWDTPFVSRRTVFERAGRRSGAGRCGPAARAVGAAEGKAGWALLALSLAALVVNAGVYVAQGGERAAPAELPRVCRAACADVRCDGDRLLRALGGWIAVDAAGLLRGRVASKASVATASALVFVGIFVMRFALLHDAHDLRDQPVARCPRAMCYACYTYIY